MRYLDNLRGVGTTKGDPWDFQGEIPEEARTNKKKRDTWITGVTTRHCVYSAWEGVNTDQRISTPKGAEEGNEPRMLYGLVADYDAQADADDIANGLKRLKAYKPNWTSTSLSGNCHAVWLFETPLIVPNRRWAVAFLEYVAAEMKLDTFLAGFDRAAFLKPERYYTNSCDWSLVHGKRMEKALIQGWAVQVGRRFDWSQEGVSIPLDEIEKELQIQHPNFEWPGPFEEGTQGPTFWVAGSQSPKSATVRATGMQTFSAHATRAFYPWADLVGATFVRQYTTKQMGNAVEGIYYLTGDRRYIRQIPTGQWIWESADDIKGYLLCNRGLTADRKKGQASEADLAIDHVKNYQAIDTAVPRAFQAPGMQWVNGKRVLNTFTGKALTPADGQATWGPDGGFPWLSAYLETIFPGEQLDYIRSWMHRLYTGCLNVKLESNHTLFIAGPPGVGKTFFSNAVVSRMVGGFADAQDFLTNGAAFNSQLFECALWCVDDSTPTTNAYAHRRYSSMLKKVAANQSLQTHEKFKTPGMTNWQGGVVVTCNHDPESIRMIPGLDGSILDKLSLLRTCDAGQGVKFPGKAEVTELLDRELPALCAYLRDFTIPGGLRDDARYGIKPYHHTELVATAEQSSHDATFSQALEFWREAYFTGPHKQEAHWSGNAYAFYTELLTFSGGSLTWLKPQEADRALRGLLVRNYPGIHAGDGAGNYYIEAPSHHAKKK